MLLAAPTLQAIAAATAAVLAGSSLRNASQTLQIRRRYHTSATASTAGITAATVATRNVQGSGSVGEVVDSLGNMDRGELLELYASSPSWPTRTDISDELPDLVGDWEGRLLDNNGIVMTLVADLITNRLFGLGSGYWVGKTFLSSPDGVADNNNDNTAEAEASIISTATRHPRCGINCFRTRRRGDCSGISKRHRFDCSVEPSRLDGRATLMLRYGDYQGQGKFTSPWGSMVDEFRIVYARGNLGGDNEGQIGEGVVLLGLGSLGWSGGVWNCSPFCIWRTIGPRKTGAAMGPTRAVGTPDDTDANT